MSEATDDWETKLAALEWVGRTYRRSLRMVGKRIAGVRTYRAAMQQGLPGGRITQIRTDSAGNVIVEVIQWTK